MEYVARFQSAFPSGGCGIATMARLLAMKRPDMFLCLDSANMQPLRKQFALKRKATPEAYWDSIIDRIVKEAVWWRGAPPTDKEERAVWNARVAFLDALIDVEQSQNTRRVTAV